jgi:AcrR family transcriptional regulator
MARLHRNWLRSLPMLTGKSLSQIADEAGIARTTLYNKLRPDDPGTSTLNASIIERIIKVHRVAGPTGGGLPQGAMTHAFAEDAAPFVIGQGDDPAATALRALIAGRNGIDPWTVKTRALELAGYLPGDVVLVDLNALPRPGDAVCAQVYDWPRMKAETVMRIFERASAVDLLLARSLDPAFATPLLADGERVVIKGVLLPYRMRFPQLDAV